MVPDSSGSINCHTLVHLYKQIQVLRVAKLKFLGVLVILHSKWIVKHKYSHKTIENAHLAYLSVGASLQY